MLKGLSRGLVMWLLTLICGGCAETIERVKPDRVSLGVTGRQLKAAYNGLRVDKIIPLWEIRAKKQLRKNLDLYTKGQFNEGAVDAEHPIFAGKGEGHLESAGLGLNYFPLETRAIGLDLGLEMYYSDYRMRGQWGLVRQETPDRFWGGGGNLGIMGEIPLDKEQRWSLVWGAGHNLNTTRAEEARVNLSGWYGTIGLQLNWGNK